MRSEGCKNVPLSPSSKGPTLTARGEVSGPCCSNRTSEHGREGEGGRGLSSRLNERDKQHLSTREEEKEGITCVKLCGG